MKVLIPLKDSHIFCQNEDKYDQLFPVLPSILSKIMEETMKQRLHGNHFQRHHILHFEIVYFPTLSMQTVIFKTSISIEP